MKRCALAAPSRFVTAFQTIEANPITERRGNKPFSIFGAVDMVLSVTIRPGLARPDLLARKRRLGYHEASNQICDAVDKEEPVVIERRNKR